MFFIYLLIRSPIRRCVRPRLPPPTCQFGRQPASPSNTSVHLHDLPCPSLHSSPICPLLCFSVFSFLRSFVCCFVRYFVHSTVRSFVCSFYSFISSFFRMSVLWFIYVFIIFIAVLEASKQVFRSKKFRVLLEVVLAFGNYMNRGARGNAAGKMNVL